MIHSDNPAQRLHGILSTACAQPGDIQIKRVWSVALGIADESLQTIYHSLGLLHELTNQVEQRIRAIPDINYDLYLGGLSGVRGLISPPRLDHLWQKSMEGMDRSCLTSLAFCADTLSKHHHESVIADQDLLSVRDELTLLYGQIFASSLNIDVRLILLDLITTMLQAIDEYRVRGAAGLRKVLMYSVGLFATNHELFVEPKSKGIITKMLEVLSRVSAMVALAEKFRELSGKIQHLLNDTQS